MTTLAEWKCYLQGSHFVVNSDHHTLQRLQHQADISGRRARYAEFLQEYDCTVNYIKGKDNVVADALSRRPDLFAFTASSVRVSPTLAEQFKQQFAQDDFVKQDRSLGPAGKLVLHDGIYFHKAFNTVYVPKVLGEVDLRQLLTRECHRSALSGHFATDKVVALLQQHYYWPHMRRSVASEVECCHECQLVKPANHLKFGLSAPLPVPSRCWQHVSLDLITALPASRQGNNAVMVLVDSLSKMAHFAPCKKKLSTKDCTRLFIKEVVRLHGWPEVLVSDRDPRFDADFWRDLLERSGTQLRMSTPYHPETDGQTERANRTLLQMLRTFCVQGNPSTWEDRLPWLEHAYNSSVHASTGFSPFYLNHGTEPARPLTSLVTDTSPHVHDDSRAGRQFTKSLADALLVARTNLSTSKARQAHYANHKRIAHPFQPGDFALVDKEVYHFKEISQHKLQQRWLGPYLVIDCDANTLLLRTPADKHFYSRVNVSACKSYQFPPGEEPAILPPSFIDQETVEIGRIVGQRKCPTDGRKTEFRCRLKHPPHNTLEYDMWFTSADLRSQSLLRRYRKDCQRGQFVDGQFVPS